MSNLNRKGIVITGLSALLLLSSCLIKKQSFNFQRDVNTEFFRSLEYSSDLSKIIRIEAGERAKIYKTGFLEGWVEQNNFINWAVLSEWRKSEFTPTDDGLRSEYDCYLILFPTLIKNEEEKQNVKCKMRTKRKKKECLPERHATSFLMFSIQRDFSDTTSAKGFSKVYYGEYIKEFGLSYLLAQQVFNIKNEGNKYSLAFKKKTSLLFVFSKETLDYKDSPSMRIEKVIINDHNELTGDKRMAIDVDKIFGDPVSLQYKNLGYIFLK